MRLRILQFLLFLLTAVLVNCLGPSDTGRTDERIGTDTSRLANRTDAITITTSAGLAARRSSLINAIWGTSGLPTRSATPVGPPAGSSGYPAGANCAVIAPPSTYHPAGNTLTGMSHVQELTISMPPDANYPNDNNDGLACHFIASRPNGKLVVYNPGHGNWVNDGSDWTSDGTLPIDVNANYNYQLGDQRFIQQMLNDGYGVLLTWMPRYRPGDPGGQAQTSHAGMIQNYSASPVAHAWSYFLEPIIDSLNYVQNNSVAGGFPTYTEFDMVGLSGGGWSTVLIAALDTRIKTSIQVGGSQPLDLWTASDVAEAGANYGGLPDEQTDHKLYNVAAYRDLYLLGAAGPGRKQIQVLNLYDSCCFNPAWAGFSGGAPGAIWDSWHAVVHAYEADVNAALYNIGDPGNFRVEIDEASIQHQISRNSLGNIILPELEGARRHVGASDSSDAFVRAMSGTMWHWSFGLGWEDTQLQIVGVPAVIINGQHPMDVIYRDPLNQIRDAYQVNLFGVTTWTSQAIGGTCRSNQSEPIEGGTIVSDPAAVSWGPGRVDVLAFCPDNTLGHWFFGGANWGFDNPVPWVTGVGTPSITSMAAGTLDGTFRDMAGGASMASYSGGWGSRSLGGTIIGLPSVTATSSSLIRVYALGHDNQLYEAYRNTGSWSAWSSLSSATGSTAKLAGTPSAWGSAFGLTVYVPGTDGILKVFSLDQTWRFTNSGLVLYGSPTAVSTGAFADEVVYNNDLDFYNGASVFLGGRIQ